MIVKKGSLAHKVLVCLSQKDMTASAIARAIDAEDGHHAVRSNLLYQLQEGGLVLRHGTDIWRLTNAGVDVRQSLGDIPVRLTKRSPAEMKNEIIRRPDYYPHELNTPVNRPGAYDAFACPSLFMGKRVYRRNPATGLVQNHPEQRDAGAAAPSL